MKRYILPILGLIALPTNAQTIVDATRFGSSTITGTARYRSMGGAFGALGGDPSVMTENPAGMGIYRGNSEISFTPNLSIARTKVNASVESKQKKADCSVSNLAYIMSFKTNSSDHLVNFNVGLGFNHREGLSRKYKMTLHYPNSSFGAYLANRVNNTLMMTGNYFNPSFMQSDAAWSNNSGIAPIELYAWDCYAVDTRYEKDEKGNETPEGVLSYDQQNELYSYQRLNVLESTRNDEYNLNFSGNWDDFIFGGLTLTVNDLNSTIESEFNEDYDLSYNADWTQYLNDLETKGTGFGIKAGILLKPSDSWRLGFAAHTPTWYRMENLYNGQMTTNDTRLDYDDKGNKIPHQVSGGTTYSYKYRYQSPWQAQISSAWVLAGKALLSVEADMKDFGTQKYKAADDGFYDDDEYININDAIKDFNAIQMTYKAGAEYRVTDHFSVRAGYIYQTSPYKKDLYDNPARSRGWQNGYYGDDNGLLFDSSTKPNHTLMGAQQYYTGGLGWSGGWWHVDLSFMNHIMHEKVAAFPTTDAIKEIIDNVVTMTDDPRPGIGAVTADYCDLRTNILTWDLTIGIRF